MSAVLDAIRAANPGKFDRLSDFEMETLVGAADPRYKNLLEKEKAGPAAGLEKPPDPSTQVPGVAGARARTAERLGVPGGVAPNVSVDDAVASIPAVTGTIGAIAALPVAAAGGVATGGGAAVPIEMLGSGLGGGAGEGLRQWIQSARGKESMTPDERREAIAKEFAIQSTLPALTVPLKAAARGLYKGALDAGSGIMNRFDINALTERGLKEKILATRGGAAKAGRLLEESGQKSRGMAAAADARGVPPATAADILPGLDVPLEKAAYENLPDASLNALVDAEDQFARARSTPRSMADLERSVREGNIRSANAYQAQSKLGTPVSMSAEADAALTDKQREILQQRVPEITAEKERASDLIGLSKVLTSKKAPGVGFLDLLAATPGATLGAAGGPGGVALGALGTAALGRAIRSKGGKSGAALAIEHGVTPFTKYVATPAIRYRDALLRYLSGQDDEQQNPPNQ